MHQVQLQRPGDSAHRVFARRVAMDLEELEVHAEEGIRTSSRIVIFAWCGSPSTCPRTSDSG